MSSGAPLCDVSKAHELNRQLVQLKHDYMANGLFKTSHALEPATKEAGWELAEILGGAHVTKVLERETE